MHYVRFRHFKTSNVSSHLRFSLTRWNRYRNGVHRNNGGRPSLHVTTRRTRAQMHTRQVVSTSIRLNGKNKKKKNKNERKKKIWGNKASSSFAKARSRCCNSHEPRVLCAEPKRSVRSDLQYTYIYMYEFDKRQFRRVVLENTGSFRRIKLLSTRIDHVSLHREECILHLVFDLKYISSFVGIAFTLTWVGNYTDSERTVIAYPFER